MQAQLIGCKRVAHSPAHRARVQFAFEGNLGAFEEQASPAAERDNLLWACEVRLHGVGRQLRLAIILAPFGTELDEDLEVAVVDHRASLVAGGPRPLVPPRLASA
jgi:hypothetical protein